jgi:hypothetical protein
LLAFLTEDIDSESRDSMKFLRLAFFTDILSTGIPFIL